MPNPEQNQEQIPKQRPVRASILDALKYAAAAYLFIRGVSWLIKPAKAELDSNTLIKVWDPESHWPSPIEPAVSEPIVINEDCDAYSISTSDRLKEIETRWNQKSELEKFREFDSAYQLCFYRFGSGGSERAKNKFTKSFFLNLNRRHDELEQDLYVSNYGTSELIEAPHIFEDFEAFRNEENGQCSRLDVFGEMNMNGYKVDSFQDDGIQDFVIPELSFTVPQIQNNYFDIVYNQAGGAYVIFGKPHDNWDIFEHINTVNGYLINGFTKSD